MNMKITRDYIPHFVDRHSYIQFDSDVYTLCIDGDNPIKLNVNYLTKQLLEQVDGTCTVEQITHAFNQANNLNLSIDTIINIFDKQLVGYGIFGEHDIEKIKVKDNYLSLRINLIPARAVAKVTPFLTFFFDARVFVVLFAVSLVFLGSTFALDQNIRAIYQDSSLQLVSSFIVVVYVSLLFHEFGHAAACDKFGARSGAIGFGFYMFTPVFYADVTDAWRLKRYQRLIVDFGGIYMQMLICTTLTLIYYITGNKTLLYASFVIGISIVGNLNPFLRYDGYWALSDLLMISNLKEKSMRTLGLFFGMITGINKNWVYTKQVLFLLIYGLLSLGVLVGFLGYMVFFNNTSIIYFPINVVSFFKSILFNFKQTDFNWLKHRVVELFFPSVFYYMLIKSIIVTIKTRFLERNRAVKQRTEAIAI